MSGALPELSVLPDDESQEANKDAPTIADLISAKSTPEETRETVRGRIAIALLTMLGFLLLAAFFSVWFGWATTADTETLLTILFTPVIGLVGAVTGFYYGSQTVLNAEATVARQQSNSGTARDQDR